MEDFGDILYVLAMLAAVIFSAFKKQRKTKPNMPVPQDADQPGYDPMQEEEEEDIIKDLRELFQPKAPKQEQAEVKAEQPQAVPLHMQPKTPVTKTVSQTAVDPIKASQLENEEDYFEFDKEQIDLRQAVIYSEILTRPYQ